jgi:hypothetical protein
VSISSDLTVTREILAGATVTTDLTVTRPILAFAAAVASDFTITRQFGSQNTMQLILTGAPTGLVGLLTVSLVTEDLGIVIVAATTSGIVELPADSGRYVATVSVLAGGRYFVIWSDGTETTSELVVVQVTGQVEALGGIRIPVGA